MAAIACDVDVGGDEAALESLDHGCQVSAGIPAARNNGEHVTEERRAPMLTAISRDVDDTATSPEGEISLRWGHATNSTTAGAWAAGM